MCSQCNNNDVCLMFSTIVPCDAEFHTEFELNIITSMFNDLQNRLIRADTKYKHVSADGYKIMPCKCLLKFFFRDQYSIREALI